jgi:ComEC/Rec2-related protein
MARANWTALPIVIFSALLVAGEALGFLLPVFASLWAWMGLFTVIAGCAFWGWGLSYGKFLVSFMLGVTLAWRSEFRRMSVEEYSRSRLSNGKAPVFLLKVEGDSVSWRGKNGCRKVKFNSRIENIPVKVNSPLPDGMPLPVDGEYWRCSGWLVLRKDAACRYSRRTLWMTKKDVFEKIKNRAACSAEIFYRWISCALSRRSTMGIEWSKELSSFCNAMLLGRRDGVSYKKLRVFAAAGTVHVFAISGLHVMLIAGMLCGFLKMIRMPTQMRIAVAIPILVAYVMLIGAPPSAIRAVMMTSLYLAAYLFRRKPDSLAAWGVAVFVICGVSPEMVLNVGCILSFVVMLGIVLWLRWVAQFATPADYILKLAALESTLGCKERKKIFLSLHKASAWVLGGLGISFASWIAGAPVTAMVFERITIWSVFINILIVPLAGMAVGFAVFGVLVSFILPPLSMFFNNLAILSIYIMQKVSEWVVMLPYSSVETLPWKWYHCVMWYIAWIALFVVLSKYLPRKEHIAIKSWEKGND